MLILNVFCFGIRPISETNLSLFMINLDSLQITQFVSSACHTCIELFWIISKVQTLISVPQSFKLQILQDFIIILLMYYPNLLLSILDL